VPASAAVSHLGVRAQTEIEAERYALKALRGGSQPLQVPGHATERAGTTPLIEVVPR
jgi:hypothetical protein